MSGRLKTRLALRPVGEAELDDHVIDLAFSADGTRLAAASVSGPIVVLAGTSAGEPVLELPGHALGTTSLAWHPARPLLASGGQDGAVRLWSAAEPEGPVEITTPPGWVARLGWSHDGAYLAAAAGRRLAVWTSDGTPVFVSDEERATIADLAWRPDQSTLATASYGGIALRQPGDWANPRRLEWKGSLLRLCWAPHGRFIATGDQDATVGFWDASSGKDLRMWGYPRKVQELAWDARGRYLATGGGDTVTVWDCSGRGPEGRTPAELAGHEAPIRDLVWAHHSGTLASCGVDGRIIVWRPRDQRRPQSTIDVGAPVVRLAWSPDDRLLVAGDAQGRVHLLELTRP